MDHYGFCFIIPSNRKGDIDSLDRAFRALIYDLYSRDISKKVKSAKLRLAQRGVNINPVAPYGYLKAPGDKHRLIPNPQAAPIVQRIFTLVANGTSTEKVAAILNAEEIPTPSQIKVGTPSGHANWQPNYWRRATIDWIIRDRQYIGSMVYGKRVRPRIGVHQQLRSHHAVRSAPPSRLPRRRCIGRPVVLKLTIWIN